MKNLSSWLITGTLAASLVATAACGRTPTEIIETGYTSNTETSVSAETIKSDQAVTLKETDADALVAAQESVMTRIYQKALPSVVYIQVIQRLKGNNPKGVFPNAPRLPDDFGQRGEGSGFVWDDQGRIVTNQHVVGDAETVTVIFSDRTQVRAIVLGGDSDSDLAVL